MQIGSKWLSNYCGRVGGSLRQQYGMDIRVGTVVLPRTAALLPPLPSCFRECPSCHRRCPRWHRVLSATIPCYCHTEPLIDRVHRSHAAHIRTDNALLRRSTARSTVFMPCSVQIPRYSAVPTRYNAALTPQRTVLSLHSVRQGFNVAKRSIWDQCKKKYIIENRPTDDLTFGKIQMVISPQAVVRSTSCLVLPWGLSLLLVSRNPRWRLGRHLGKFKWRYLRGGSSDLLRVWF